MKGITKSKMRIYKDRGHSDHEIYLYMTVNMEDVAMLHIIKTAHEDISLPADDILEALQSRVYEIVYEQVQRALSND